MMMAAECYRYTRLARPVLRQKGQAGRCAVAESAQVQHMRCPQGVITASTSLVRQMRHFQPSEASSIWPRRLLAACTAHGPHAWVPSYTIEALDQGPPQGCEQQPAHWSTLHALGRHSASHEVFSHAHGRTCGRAASTGMQSGPRLNRGAALNCSTVQPCSRPAASAPSWRRWRCPGQP